MNSFTYGSSPNEFGMEIDFDSAYMYTGGHLLIEIRHTGFSGTSRSVDAIGTAISGYGTLFSACWTGNYSGTSGAQGNFAAVKIGSGGIVGIHETQIAPDDFNLSQNYPNPFNPKTSIEFSIPKESNVKITVYDSQGKEVLNLINQKLKAGSYRASFDGTDFSSGVYHYRLTADNFVRSRSMLLIK